MARSSNMYASGSFVGTGAAIEVKGDKVGFKPSSVRLYNRTDGSFAFWTEDMGDAAMMKQKANTTSFVTSDGVTALASGFQLGADADLNAASDTIYFEAWD